MSFTYYPDRDSSDYLDALRERNQQREHRRADPNNPPQRNYRWPKPAPAQPTNKEASVMSANLESLLGAERRAECERNDALLRSLHRIPAPQEGRQSEASRRASCHALGLNPDAPLAFLDSPMVRFWGLVGSVWAGVVSFVWWMA